MSEPTLEDIISKGIKSQDTHNFRFADILIDGAIPYMDEKNKKAALIMKTQGTDAAVKHMFNPTGDRELSYAEMRTRYG